MKKNSDQLASNLPPLRGKAVVTGCSSGIGKEIVNRLLKDDWLVVGICRSKLESHHPNFKVIHADVAQLPDAKDALETQEGASTTNTNHTTNSITETKALSCSLHKSFFDQLLEDGVPTDAFVHAAGFMRTAALGDLSAEDGLSMWRVHVGAAQTIANALIPTMRDGGRIVLMGSRVALGAPNRSQYAATKAALIGLTRSWAAELAPRGITANVIAPGATDTPFLRDPARVHTPPKLPPMGRFVRTEEVAELTAFLLGPYGGAITGQHLVMCAGASLSF